jgi:hypothetical protein
MQAVRAFYRHDWRIWLAVGLTAVLFATGVAYMLLASQGATLGLALVVALPAVLIYLFVAWPAQLGKQVRRDRELCSLNIWQIGDENILIRDLSGDTRFRWSDFYRVVETGHHYLLVFAVNHRAYAIVPKSAFASVEQEAEFRGIVCRHLPGLRETSQAMEPPVR